MLASRPSRGFGWWGWMGRLTQHWTRAWSRGGLNQPFFFSPIEVANGQWPWKLGDMIRCQWNPVNIVNGIGGFSYVFLLKCRRKPRVWIMFATLLPKAQEFWSDPWNPRPRVASLIHESTGQGSRGGLVEGWNSCIWRLDSLFHLDYPNLDIHRLSIWISHHS